MLGCCVIALFSTKQTSFQIVCTAFAQDRWKVLLWRGRPNSPTSSLMCASCGFIEKEEVCHLVAEGAIIASSTLFCLFYFNLYAWFSCIKKISKPCKCWAVRPCSSESINCLVLIPHRQLGECGRLDSRSVHVVLFPRYLCFTKTSVKTVYGHCK